PVTPPPFGWQWQPWATFGRYWPIVRAISKLFPQELPALKYLPYLNWATSLVNYAENPNFRTGSSYFLSTVGAFSTFEVGFGLAFGYLGGQLGDYGVGAAYAYFSSIWGSDAVDLVIADPLA